MSTVALRTDQPAFEAGRRLWWQLIGNNCGTGSWISPWWDAGLVWNNCGTGAGGFKPGNTCSRGGGSHAAAEMPSDWTGEVEILDAATGEVLTTADAQEVRQMLADQKQQAGTIDDLKVRKATAETKAEQVSARRQAEQQAKQRVKEAERISSLKTPHGLRPGHPDYQEPPERLYHATFDAEAIRQEGFKSSDELGRATLGGSSGHLVSFTTRENAESYRQGLDLARRGARGELTDQELISAGQQYGLTASRARQLLGEIHKDSPEQTAFEYLQRVSLEGQQFPLYMGGSWPGHLKTSKPPELVSISSSSVSDLYYNPSEQEWRVGDYRGVTANLTGNNCGTGNGGFKIGRSRMVEGSPFGAGVKSAAKSLEAAGIDPESLNRRDSGFFGPGFYVSQEPQDLYGKSLVSVTLKSDAKILQVGGLKPNSPQPWHGEFVESLRKRILRHRPGFPEERLKEEIERVTPGTSQFNHLEYLQEVSRFARSEGYQAAMFADGQETVVFDPSAIEGIKHLGGLKAAQKHKLSTNSRLEVLRELAQNNCGTGKGGFKPGNTCAKGGLRKRSGARYLDPPPPPEQVLPGVTAKWGRVHEKSKQLIKEELDSLIRQYGMDHPVEVVGCSGSDIRGSARNSRMVPVSEADAEYLHEQGEMVIDLQVGGKGSTDRRFYHHDRSGYTIMVQTSGPRGGAGYYGADPKKFGKYSSIHGTGLTSLRSKSPEDAARLVIVHEFGHLKAFQAGWGVGDIGPANIDVAKRIGSWYARTNLHETYAEAFVYRHLGGNDPVVLQFLTDMEKGPDAYHSRR